MAIRKQTKATTATARTSTPRTAPEAAGEQATAAVPFPAGAGAQAAQEPQGEALAADVAQEQAQPAGEPEQPKKHRLSDEDLAEVDQGLAMIGELMRGLKRDRQRETPRSYTLKPVARALDDILEGMEDLVTALDWICEGAREETAAYDRGPVRAVAGLAKAMRAKLDPMSGLLHQVDHWDSVRLDLGAKDPHVELEAEAERIRTAWLADQADEAAADEDPRVQAIDDIERKIADTTALTLPGIAAQVRLALRLATKEGDDHASLGPIEVQGLRSALGSLEALSVPEDPDLT